MANLSENTTYEAGIYQLETSDPVDAGTSGNGVSNLQAKQLANRTNWLNTKLLALLVGGGADNPVRMSKGGLGADNSARPAEQIPYTSAIGVIDWLTSTSFGRSLLTLVDVDALKALVAGSAQAAAAQAVADAISVASVCQGRLTLAAGNPTSDNASGTAIRFTPYLGAQVSLWVSGRWEVFNFTERSISLAGRPADTNCDVFLWNNAGILTLETIAWTNNTTRAASLSVRDGVYVKTSDDRRYLGTIRTTTAGNCSDTPEFRYVWNSQNRIPKISLKQMAGIGSYTMANGSFWRPCNNDSQYRLSFVVGQRQAIRADSGLIGGANPASEATAATGIGLNTTTANSAQIYSNRPNTIDRVLINALYAGTLEPGYNFLQMLETSGSNVTQTFEGDAGDRFGISGITALWDC